MTRTSSLEAEISKVIERQAQGIHDKDAKAAVSHYAANAVIFDLAPPLRNASTGPALEQSLNDWFATWQGPIGYETRDFSITANDDVAFGHGFVRITGTKVDGEHNDLWVRQSLGFRKINGAWKIAHDHTSVPFYMDGSYKAAVDLKP
ncbi:YybH family protein [Dongia deserti]|uniref:YybH family protein n=1 Tax=Dongia deserti TaxID=2268030 RepID=UPI000E64F622|nr:nuclear transport factor 2 family protein [Dongia deserti]